MAGRLNRGDVRLVRFPPPDKERPVLVLTRESIIPALARVTIAPLTSTLRGIPTEVALGPEDGLKSACAVNLDNVMTIHRRFVGRRVATLTADKMHAVCGALAFALGCEAPDKTRGR